MPVSIKNKNLTLGVLVTRTGFTLAMVSSTGFTSKKELVKWRSFSFPEGMMIQSDEFPSLLGNCLDRFLEGKKKIPIWCSIDSAGLKIKNINIPDISKSKTGNAAFWGLKKETEFDEKQEIFNFEILGAVKIDGIKKKNILVFSAPRDEVTLLQNVFKKAGYFLTGVTAIPFAIQNFIRTRQIVVDDSYFAFVNISRDQSEVYCFSQSGILLGRTLRTGSQSLINEFDHSLEMDPVDYLSSMKEMESEEFMQIRESAFRMISKIARTGDYCSQYYTDNTPIQRYLFYGELDQCKPFIQLASTMTTGSTEILEPIRDNLTDSIAVPIPQDAKKRSNVLSAFGIALSDNHITPNFLFTFSDHRKLEKRKKIIQAMILTGMLCFILCFAAQFYLSTFCKQEKENLVHLEKTIKKMEKVPEGFISEAIENARMDNLKKKEYIASYLPLAVISDICHFTPENIYLTSMTYELKKGQGAVEDSAEPENQETAGDSYRVVKKVFINGQVSGHSYTLESEFDSYILKLTESPVFDSVEIASKQIKVVNDKKRLYFQAALEVN